MVEEIKKSNTKLLWIVSAIFFVVFFVSLVLVKLSNPDFSLGILISLIIIGMLVIGAIIFAVSYFNKKKIDPINDIPKIPKACDKKTAYAIAQHILSEPPFADYLDENTIEKDTIEEVGKGQKTSIYCLVGRGIYVNCKYAIILNMHVPHERNTVLRNPTDYEMNKYKQLLSFSPEDEPDIERITTENMMTGNKQLVERITKKEEKKDKAPETKEDLE